MCSTSAWSSGTKGNALQRGCARLDGLSALPATARGRPASSSPVGVGVPAPDASCYGPTPSATLTCGPSRNSSQQPARDPASVAFVCQPPIGTVTDWDSQSLSWRASEWNQQWAQGATMLPPVPARRAPRSRSASPMPQAACAADQAAVPRRAPKLSWTYAGKTDFSAGRAGGSDEHIPSEAQRPAWMPQHEVTIGNGPFDWSPAHILYLNVNDGLAAAGPGPAVGCDQPPLPAVFLPPPMSRLNRQDTYVDETAVAIEPDTASIFPAACPRALQSVAIEPDTASTFPVARPTALQSAAIEPDTVSSFPVARHTALQSEDLLRFSSALSQEHMLRGLGTGHRLHGFEAARLPVASIEVGSGDADVHSNPAPLRNRGAVSSTATSCLVPPSSSAPCSVPTRNPKPSLPGDAPGPVEPTQACYGEDGAPSSSPQSSTPPKLLRFWQLAEDVKLPAGVSGIPGIQAPCLGGPRLAPPPPCDVGLPDPAPQLDGAERLGRAHYSSPKLDAPPKLGAPFGGASPGKRFRGMTDDAAPRAPRQPGVVRAASAEAAHCFSVPDSPMFSWTSSNAGVQPDPKPAGGMMRAMSSSEDDAKGQWGAFGQRAARQTAGRRATATSRTATAMAALAHSQFLLRWCFDAWAVLTKVIRNRRKAAPRRSQGSAAACGKPGRRCRPVVDSGSDSPDLFAVLDTLDDITSVSSSRHRRASHPPARNMPPTTVHGAGTDAATQTEAPCGVTPPRRRDASTACSPQELECPARSSRSPSPPVADAMPLVQAVRAELTSSLSSVRTPDASSVSRSGDASLIEYSPVSSGFQWTPPQDRHVSHNSRCSPHKVPKLDLSIADEAVVTPDRCRSSAREAIASSSRSSRRDGSYHPSTARDAHCRAKAAGERTSPSGGGTSQQASGNGCPTQEAAEVAEAADGKSDMKSARRSGRSTASRSTHAPDGAEDGNSSVGSSTPLADGNLCTPSVSRWRKGPLPPPPSWGEEHVARDVPEEAIPPPQPPEKQQPELAEACSTTVVAAPDCPAPIRNLRTRASSLGRRLQERERQCIALKQALEACNLSGGSIGFAGVAAALKAGEPCGAAPISVPRRPLAPCENTLR
eukprot:gnl/TRDRNA2_/TRDRNA2_171572_c0_seq1.p1 gnl/TRDRNA2_/TRDRNA2_171572_c0~~gnl/TRDRNA2_/TRDRNA2_171572_c0_seq1.p1  ORF type:complete len:1150 (+),score=156.00 gnl/TRDRNA2_/TRDRNA2_171572_c0_seq1:152-3451(+)